LNWSVTLLRATNKTDKKETGLTGLSRLRRQLRKALDYSFHPVHLANPVSFFFIRVLLGALN
jgi:hypothetical protein